MPVSKGDLVRVNYKGTLPNGAVFDSTERHGPLEFRIGDGTIIPGFEQGVIGMEVGEKRNVIVAPEEGYGPHSTDLVQELDMNDMPRQPTVGSLINIEPTDGTDIMQGLIVEVEGEKVLVDLNHPLSGQTLHFAIDLLSIIEKAN